MTLDEIGVLLDPTDYEWLKSESWFLAKGYVKHVESLVRLHQFIMMPDCGQSVDHINGDGRDNRRQNLRLSTQAENCFNKRISKANTSGFKGVHYQHTHHKWRAKIDVCGKRLHLGLFSAAEDAALAYDRAARTYYGEFAALNFPVDGETQA